MTDECSMPRVTNNHVVADAEAGDSTDTNPMGEKSVVSAPVSAPVIAARAPTEKYAREYNMDHKNRGLALIFNHEHFNSASLKPRAGTNADSDSLCQALENLHFNVSVHKDCKFSEVLNLVEKAASQDHTDNDCLLITILSHGEHGCIFAKDVPYNLDTLSNYFTGQHCPTLAGKPKLFLIQACRGDRFDEGITMQRNRTETDGESQSTTFKLPQHADFLYAHSTVPGYYSWRNVKQGSWFIQSLVQELNDNGKKEHILTLLTFVCRRVAIDFESNVPYQPIMDRQKQIPCVSTMLTRLLIFRDKSSKAA